MIAEDARPKTQPPVAVLTARDPKDQAARFLEQGAVLLLPDLDFDTAGFEAAMFAQLSDEASKNVSYNPATGELKGTTVEGPVRDQLAELVARYAKWSEDLVRELLPAYSSGLQIGRTSYRPRSADHNMSKRKDDRRLHVDAFPSTPMQGRRILRVFRNVNPNGESRFWRVGEPFADYAGRFLPRARPMAPGLGGLMQALGITRGRRTAYDALMLQLHDQAKDDDAYQAAAPHWDVSFPPGATWLVFTDAVVHAALGGRYAFEQTFYLPVACMENPAASPLKTLERLTGKVLA
ncbi:MAG: 3-deoxy-D-manno-oct-2-ulosonic acid (Kdo) hydroxylase [Phenylobacterium sp.]|nr:MAG: 3-deoxy-D-manno-oct-2-ulosonic acid (Kdo) hydroxylase [Phenylobacterium sp.]